MTTLVVTIAGPIIGAFFGLSTFFVKRAFTKTDAQLIAIAESVEEIHRNVDELRVMMPTNYVSKSDFYKHVGDEESWQRELKADLRLIREEFFSYRARAEHNNGNHY